MKNIETPLTWALGTVAIVLIILSSLNSTSINFNISDVKSDANNGFNLNHDHKIQEPSSYNIYQTNNMISDEEIVDEKEEQSDQEIIINSKEEDSEE